MLKQVYPESELYQLKELHLIEQFKRDFEDYFPEMEYEGVSHRTGRKYEMESLEDLSRFLQEHLEKQDAYTYDAVFAKKFRESRTLAMFTTPLVKIAEQLNREGLELFTGKDFPTGRDFCFDFRFVCFVLFCFALDWILKNWCFDVLKIATKWKFKNSQKLNFYRHGRK